MQIFDSYIEAGHTMSKRDREQYYAALIEYLFYGIEPQVRGTALAVITAIRPSLDESRTRIVSGRKGGRPRKNQDRDSAETKTPEIEKPNGSIPENQNRDSAETKTHDSTKTKSKGNGNEKELPNGSSKKPRFVPPSVEEVDAYLADRGLSAYLTGTQFVGYYGSQGWKKANGQPVTNWKLAASGWADRERKKSGGDGVDYGNWNF